MDKFLELQEVLHAVSRVRGVENRNHNLNHVRGVNHGRVNYDFVLFNFRRTLVTNHKYIGSGVQLLCNSTEERI